MNAHIGKTSRIATLEGVFERNPKTGLYEPWEPETRWPLWRGMLPLIFLSWGIIGLVCVAWRAWPWL